MTKSFIEKANLGWDDLYSEIAGKIYHAYKDRSDDKFAAALIEGKYRVKAFWNKKIREVVGEAVTLAVNELSGKPPCTKDDPCGCHFGEVFHADGKCACDLTKELLAKLNSILGEGNEEAK